MNCPKCGYEKHAVKDTDADFKETIERVRKCEKCGFRFETQETYKYPDVVKKINAVAT